MQLIGNFDIDYKKGICKRKRECIINIFDDTDPFKYDNIYIPTTIPTTFQTTIQTIIPTTKQTTIQKATISTNNIIIPINDIIPDENTNIITNEDLINKKKEEIKEKKVEFYFSYLNKDNYYSLWLEFDLGLIQEYRTILKSYKKTDIYLVTITKYKN